MQWLPSDRYYGRPIPVSPRLFQGFALISAPAAYDPQQVEWLPSGIAPQVALERRRLGDFQQPGFDSLYKAEALQWQSQERYFGRALVRGANDYTVQTLLIIAAAYDPQTLAWLARSVYPQVPVERRLLGDFQQPAFDAIYKSEGLQWFQGERYFCRPLARSLNDWSVLVQLVTAAAYDPKNIEWQARDSYSGRQLARALVDWSVYQGVPIISPSTTITPTYRMHKINRGRSKGH
jgi:hypothetical protein